MDRSCMFKLSICFSLFLLLISTNVNAATAIEHRNKTSSAIQTYIVHLYRTTGTESFSDDDSMQWYESFLPPETSAERKSPSSSRLVHAYKAVATGFAARLTEDELNQIKRKAGFAYAYPDELVPLATTHTPEFLGLSRGTAGGFWNDSNYGKGVIIGVLDTGIFPGHPSFADVGMPPPPSKWKGTCEFNASSCNNKLIGARNFVQGETAMPPHDHQGHGTHTASTAAGTFVENANVLGQANGTASGIAPLAHLAIYKVCGDKGCARSDILAGLDAAVGDGVDVLSMSLGGPSVPFYEEVTAIGAYAAIERGIFVSCAAGNRGPSYATLSNEAPWILTVGASTNDRSIRSTVQLGSGAMLINGKSLNQPSNFASTVLPLVYPGPIEGPNAAYCTNGSLDGINVKGMIVLCDEGLIPGVEKGANVMIAGGAAMILASDYVSGFTNLDEVNVLPTSHVSHFDGLMVKQYINSATSPTASISFKGTVLGASPSPMVAGFSSRGPNQADGNILKPDIIGPGVNILAAWPFQVGPPNAASSTFIMGSGTSMSTPHLSGIAALLKSSHPDWSPAAIKSAIMTTANAYSNDGKFIPDQAMVPADLFAVGSGHVNVSRANNPGLVYDIAPEEYVGYLCGIPYSSLQVTAIIRRLVKCSDAAAVSGADLNYPSLMVFLAAANSYTAVVTRTVTNVGAASSKYTVQVKAPPGGASVTVKPEALSFAEVGEKAKFTVTFVGSVSSGGSSIASYSEGYLRWLSADGSIVVNSPIMVAVG